ncbi:MAG: S1C family serine protease [Acidimicrobiaceae bacterium]|nr:S1C family serine protease [Acidimicrobiaceae bacterium]
MSDSPQSGYDEQAGDGSRAGDFHDPQDGYRASMPPPPAWPTSPDAAGWRDPSEASGGWGSGYAPSEADREGPDDSSGGWGSGQPAPGRGGWAWDGASGGWRWVQAAPGSRGWVWDDSVGGWRWDQGPHGPTGGVWGAAGPASGSWGAGNPPPAYPGGWGSGPWDYSGTPRRRPPSRRGARILTALLAAALVAAIVGAGLGQAHSVGGSSDPVLAPSANPGSQGAGSSSGPSFGQQGQGPSSPQSSSPPASSPQATSPQPTTGGNVPATPAEVEAVGKRVSPALVDINTTLSYSQEQAAGTGIVLSSNGEILTNNHVINGETSIQVTDVGNGKTYQAKVLGYDHAQDIAVVQLIGASGLAAASVGNSSNLVAGQSVVAIGNAGGTGGQPSITGGSISSLDQSITASDEGDGTSEQLNDLIQSNASIQPGDSGGSLVNLSGQVIGVDTAASDGFSFQTGSRNPEGFSIPINRAMEIARDILAGQGSPSIHVGATAFLGVDVSGAGQGNSPATGSGATISQVIANGAAASAGLVAGDTITSFGGKTVSSSTDLTDIIEIYHPGQTAEVAYIDSGGQSHTVNVTLASGPPS